MSEFEKLRDKIWLKRLARDEARGIQMDIIKIEPGLDDPPHWHDDWEWVYILEGEIELLYGTEIYLLRKGDYAYFDSHTPHNARSVGDKKAETLVVIFPHKRL